MRQALIAGARPRFVKGKPFPKVPLESGTWRIDVENQVSSKIRLTVERSVAGQEGTFTVPSVYELGGDSVKLIDGPVVAFAEVYEAGTEPHISVYATRMNGSKS